MTDSEAHPNGNGVSPEDDDEEDQVSGRAPAAPGSQSPPASSTAQSSRTKRRKVNHACVYCRRSHMTCNEDRPCTRCVKRNIGHLCHDEAREPKKQRPAGQEEPVTSPKASPVNGMVGESEAPSFPNAPPPLPAPKSSGPSVTPVSVAPRNMNQNFLGFGDWDAPPPQQPNYSNPYHQQWMFSTPEVSSEFNLLSDFLGNLYSEDIFDQQVYEPVQQNGFQRPTPHAVAAIARPASVRPSERARENYYLTAADPNKEAPEERMRQVLKAKLEAGLLKPFNYVKGYARLSQYMEKNMQPNSRKRILGQLDKFRPKFRERTQSLTDLDLVHVEEWFEKSLLEYDRVFASMAVPACLWRRTGEIFRGNKEFAELINVPIEHMRDGKLAIYELVVEDSAVSYWEKFGTIAFDTTQKAMLTSCHLKNPDPNASNKLIHCCFSFTIRRDSYDIPAMIIGNFMPINPKKPVS